MTDITTAKNIMENEIKYAKEQNCYKVVLQSGIKRTDAHVFYESLGFDGDSRYRNLLDGHRLRKGEVYTLKITYTASRDLENDLLVGFVDMEGGKWKTLSYTQRDIEPPNVILDHASKAGEEVSSEVTISILKDARISSVAANTLVIETIGEGRHRRVNSGVQGPVTILFSEFDLQKVICHLFKI